MLTCVSASCRLVTILSLSSVRMRCSVALRSLSFLSIKKPGSFSSGEGGALWSSNCSTGMLKNTHCQSLHTYDHSISKQWWFTNLHCSSFNLWIQVVLTSLSSYLRKSVRCPLTSLSLRHLTLGLKTKGLALSSLSGETEPYSLLLLVSSTTTGTGSEILRTYSSKT